MDVPLCPLMTHLHTLFSFQQIHPLPQPLLYGSCLCLHELEFPGMLGLLYKQYTKHRWVTDRITAEASTFAKGQEWGKRTSNSHTTIRKHGNQMLEC
jgi:hypothetical protein